MKKLAGLFLIFWFFAGAVALAAELKSPPPKPLPYQGLRKRIGVLPIDVRLPAAVVSTQTTTPGLSFPFGKRGFTWPIPFSTETTTVATGEHEALPGQLGTAMTEQLTTALINTGRFVVLERKALEEVIREQDLARAGRVNPETAAPTGKLTGAEWLIKAAITEYEGSKTSKGGGISLEGIDIGGHQSEAFVKLDVRLIDAATGQVIDSLAAEGRAKSSGTRGSLRIGDLVVRMGKEDKTPIGAATREALANAVSFIVERMEKEPWRGRVVEVIKKEVYLNAGSDMNVRVGDTFAVFRPVKKLVDPDTGEVIGAVENRLGTLTIKKVEPKFSTGVTRGSPPRRGDIVRPLVS